MADLFGDHQTLLLVEDDARTLTELERIMGRHTSFHVMAFQDPQEALAGTEGVRLDLALLDVRLPGVDGLTLLAMLRERHPDLIALVMTGFREEWSARESRERGAVDFLEKPLDLSYLLTVLRQQSRESEVRRSLRLNMARTRTILDRIEDGVALEGNDGCLLAANDLGRVLLKEEGEGAEIVEEQGRFYACQIMDLEEGTLHHWRDLTDSLEAERGRAYRHMGRLLAHELRNPLTPMRLWLQELESLPHGDEHFEELARQATGVLLGQVDRLSALVDQFQTLGRRGTLERSPLHLLPVLQEVERILVPMAEGSASRIICEGDPSARVHAHERALYQVVFNLVRNALEAQGKGGGEVHLSCRAADNGEVEVRVEDEGGGLPPEVEEAPFQPYLTTKESGTGLGLLVCRELLGRMGAELRLENQPGVGLSASFRLPSAREE